MEGEGLKNKQQCQCNIIHCSEVQRLASDENHQLFLQKKVNLGGGEKKTVKEIIEDGMVDFPNWMTKQYSIPAVDDASTHETVKNEIAYLVAGVTGDELYHNYIKSIMLNLQYNLEDIVEALDDLITIAKKGDDKLHAEQMQSYVDYIKFLQNNRCCQSKDVKDVVDRIIKIALNMAIDEDKTVIKAPILYTAFYKFGGDQRVPKSLELFIFKTSSCQILFYNKPKWEFLIKETEVEKTRRNIELLESEIDQLKKNINIVVRGIDLLLWWNNKVEPELHYILKKKLPENKLIEKIKGLEKERTSVLKVLNMVKSSKIFKDKPSIVLHSYDFKWLKKT